MWEIRIDLDVVDENVFDDGVGVVDRLKPVWENVCVVISTDRPPATQE